MGTQIPFIRLSTLSSESRARIYTITHRKKAALSKFERRRGFGLFQVYIIDHTKQQNSFCQVFGDDDSVFFCLGQVERTRRNALRQSSRRRRHPILFALLLLPK